MAKSYAQRNAESIVRTGKSLYERRIESGIAQGRSRAESRGHGGLPAKAPLPPTPEVSIKKRPSVPRSQLPEDLRGIPRQVTFQGNKIYTVRSEQAALNAIREAARDDKRVIITVYSANTGESHTIYISPTMWYGGITAQYLLDQMAASGRSLDEQLEHDFAESSCGPLPELGDIGLYTISFVNIPKAA